MDKGKKEKSLLKRFIPYMGKKAILLPIALVMSALAAILSIIPFVMIWFLLREIFGSLGNINMDNVMFYAWVAFAAALLHIVVYFGALLSSHLAAFRVETEMQTIGLEKILKMPIGFLN